MEHGGMKFMSEKNPILYLLVRNDLPSMNPGKAMAQVSHATNALVLHKERGANDNLKKLYAEWADATPQGFGTALVLEASKQQILLAIENTEAFAISGYIIDPTYPYSANSELADLIPTELDTLPRKTYDKTTYLWRRELTCAYIFGDKEELKNAVGNLKLHP